MPYLQNGVTPRNQFNPFRQPMSPDESPTYGEQPEPSEQPESSEQVTFSLLGISSTLAEDVMRHGDKLGDVMPSP